MDAAVGRRGAVAEMQTPADVRRSSDGGVTSRRDSAGGVLFDFTLQQLSRLTGRRATADPLAPLGAASGKLSGQVLVRRRLNKLFNFSKL